MSHSLYRLGHWAARRPWSVLAIWLAVSVAVIGASAGLGRPLEDSFGAPGLDSQEAIDLLESAGFDESGLTAQVVVTPTDETATFFDAPAATAELATLHGSLVELPNVLATTDPAAALAAGPEAAVGSGTVSPDGKVALIRLQYPQLESLSIDDLDRLKDALGEAQVQDGGNASAVRIEAGGDLFFSFEEPETGLGEMMGLVAAVVVLLVAFGSLLAMGLPIGIALFGVALGSSSMLLFNHLIDIPSWTPQIAAMVGIGVGIDYALFLVVRHRENLTAGHSVAHSAGLAVATAGQAVIFAGGTVVIAILGLAVAGIPFVTAAGVGMSIMVGIMVLGAVTLLPALLGLFGHRVNGLRSSRRTRHAAGAATSAAAAVTPRWERWGTHVSRHAWFYAIGVTALLLAATSPVLGLRLGFPDQGTQSETRTERRAYDLVAEGFGPGINGPLVIAADVAADPSRLEPLAAAIEADTGVAAVAPPVMDDASGVAMLIAFPTTAPQDDQTYETIQRIRAEVFPEVLGADVNTVSADEAETAGSGFRAHVGGQTATFADLGEQAGERMPYFIGAVLILSIVLLTMVFRSVVVPIKAAVLNLLSIGASYGVLVMVFQWGWGKELIGLETTVPIVSFIPMFMFAILFGLSMDYEVFLLSRVREEYQATGDNDASVIRGLAGTGRVITSAALIMISVFAGFVISDDPINKMFGLGLAVAIAVDASIVRMVLVPASMKLMGDANWWLPGWLDRVLPEIDIEGGHMDRSVLDNHADVLALDGPTGNGSDGIDGDRRRVPEVTGTR